MGVREDLHRLTDALTEEAAREALEYMRFLLCEEDKEPLSPEEAADADRTWHAHVVGDDPGEPLEKLRAELTARGRG